MTASGYANGAGSNANWQSGLGFTGAGTPSAPAQSSGGGYYSVLDMKRAASNTGRVPAAQYPDG